LTHRTSPPSARLTVLGLGENAVVVISDAPCTMVMSPVPGAGWGPVVLSDPHAASKASMSGASETKGILGMGV
jgi:hypothetical protein